MPKSKIEIDFEFPWSEFEFYYNKALEKFNQGLVLDGFRPGKAPLEVVEKRMDQAKLLQEAAELTLQEKYPRFLMDNNLEPVGQPEVEIFKLAKNNEFICKVKAEILPEVKLPDYQSIAKEFKKNMVNVEDAEIEKTLEWLGKSRATFEDLNRPCQKDDFVEIAYESPQIENSKVFEDQFLLGRGQFIPGFEEYLGGMKSGEEKEFELVFPEDYFKKDLASQKVNFKATIKKAQKMNLPVIDDDFVKALGRFETLDELRQSIKDGIIKEKEKEESGRVREEMIEKIAAKTEIDIPEIVLTQERARIVKDIQDEAAEKLQIPFEEYIEKNYPNRQDFQSFTEAAAQKRVKYSLVLQEIGRRENIVVNEEEVEAAVNQFLSNFSRAKDVENKIDPETLRSYYEGIIYNDKVFKKLEKFR